MQFASLGRELGCPLLSSWGAWVQTARPGCPGGRGGPPGAPQRQGGGAGSLPCGGAGKPLPLRRVPGDSGRGEGDVDSPPPHACLSHPLPRDLGGGREVGREAGTRTEKAWEREIASWGIRGREGSIRARRKGPWGEEDPDGEVVVGRSERESFPFRVAQGDLFPGEPPPSSSQPREQRVWEARSGSGAEVEGGRKASGGGRGGRLPHFLSRPYDGKLPAANASRRPLQIREGSGSLPNGCPPSLPPPASPPPLGTEARELRGRQRPRRGRNRGAAAPPAGAGRPRSRRAAPTLKVEPAPFPTRAFGSPATVFHRLRVSAQKRA